MSQDNPSSQQPETHEPYQERQDPAPPVSIATTDPSVESAMEHQSDWKRHPDGTVSVATTQICEPRLREASQDQGRGKKQGDQRARRRDDKDQDRGREEDDGHDEQPPERDQPRQQQPSMMKNLLMTAGVALICGVIGAAGYLYFLGAKPEKSPSSQKKPDSESAKEATEKKKSGFSGTESVMESNSRGASSIPGFTAADDADTLRKQIADLMQRVDGLSARVDRMTRPKDETPPVLHTMQIKMAELARVMDEVASLPAKVRYYDNRLETMQEEIKTLRSRIESLTGGRVEGLNPNLALPRPSSAAARRRRITRPKARRWSWVSPSLNAVSTPRPARSF